MDVFRLPTGSGDQRLPSTHLGAIQQLGLLLAAIDLSQEALALTDLATGGCLDCSGAAHQRLGLSRSAYLALGLGGLQADQSDGEGWLRSQLPRFRAERTGSFLGRHRHSNGSCLDVQVRFQVLNVEGRELLLTIHRDHTELLTLRSRADQLNQLLLEAEALTLVGSWELLHSTGEMYWSEGTHRIFEMPANNFSPSYDTFLEAVHPEDRDRVRHAYETSLTTREPYHVTHRLICPDGRVKVLQERATTTYGNEGQPLRSIGTVQDITRLAEAEQELQRLAFTDGLTQLANRQGALRYLSELCGQPLSTPAAGFGVFNLDVDQFQAINDSCGADAVITTPSANTSQGT